MRPIRSLLFTFMCTGLIISGCQPTETDHASYENNGEYDARVTVGADRLFDNYSRLIDGRRVALVANHTGRLSDGTHMADALFEYPDAELVALFGMYSNVRSNDYSLPRDGDAAIDPETGVPKYNLYTNIHKPTAEMLREVDVILFDIQEVGARFYEHVNILGFVMEAAAENDISVVVLDRPNPIRGVNMDGFITDEEFLFGFGAYAPIPVIHGMTVGELAQLYNGEGMLRNGLTVDLHIVEMIGWRRSMWFDETGLEWVKPSPNLPTLSSTLAYTGTCLFEGLNLSEGRGTPRPFEYIGAPWLDHESVAQELNQLNLPGVLFEPILFTPERKPFHGRDPVFTGEECQGIFVNITDRDLFQPYRTGVSMVWAVQKVHPHELQWNESTMERLVGSRRLMHMIRDGSYPEEVFASWEKELQAFTEMAQSYLLYP